jgi:RNA polymerase sigma factor (sigma-70 family)
VAKNYRLSPDDFEQLLCWLDADREAAGRKYESIRLRLIKIFLARKCCGAEELADETIDRVTGKINQLIGVYKGEPELYFYAVARNVIFENQRQKPPAELSTNLAQPENNEIDETDESSVHRRCLDKCLGKLPAEKKQFILEYYQGEKSVKLERRRRMAEKEGISNHVLRNRALRLRARLQKCVLKCVQNSETFPPEIT